MRWLWLAVVGCGYGDNDGDGISVGQGDCDDLDPHIGPGQDEWCDGIDEDCDGVVDNDARDVGTYYIDGDGDGFGDQAKPVVACERGEYTLSSSDCDDDNPEINPAAEDTESKDRNCDGEVGVDAEGRWTGSCDPTYSYGFTLEIQLDLDITDRDGKLSGGGDIVHYEVYQGYALLEGPVDLDGDLDRNDVSFSVVMTEYAMTVGPFVGTLDGDVMDLELGVPATQCRLTR